MIRPDNPTAEHSRLAEDAARKANWKRWGPYLAERQWGTVREDYSADGNCWDAFTHDQARSRAYRWGEDGLLGFTDRECRLCFALTLWNGKDPILKERLFGLTNQEGNHGEDVKETYFYVDATPTFSYLKAIYKYPQSAFPYDRLLTENSRRGLDASEFELADSGVFDDNRFFDITAEYAKAGPNDILIQISIANPGPETAELHVLPTIWFRNTWSWDCRHEGCTLKPRMTLAAPDRLCMEHETLERFILRIGKCPGGEMPTVLFTENETNHERLFNAQNPSPYVKDAFHRLIIQGEQAAVNPREHGTKAALHYSLPLPSGASRQIRLRLHAASADETGAEADTHAGRKALGKSFDSILQTRRREADAFYAAILPATFDTEARTIARQAYAGLLWSRQFYHYVVEDWLNGDPNLPPPPEARRQGRNAAWLHLFNRDILSVPDKWEYPWFAAWDLAFHMLPCARIDPKFAKDQLILMLREWYLHPNGQLPAYEFAFDDVNPPVHAWAAWRVYKIAAPRGQRDLVFLERAFQKLLLNFTWWVNRKDTHGRNLFAGGFLGLDNIGVFDRSKPLPTGGTLQQADGTAWMAFYCLTMMAMAMELAHGGGRLRVAYSDMASKFFEHFIQISDAMNHLGASGLWDPEDGFYYDQIQIDGDAPIQLKVRSLVGLLPLIAVSVLEQETMNRLPGFKKRFEWFVRNRRDLARHISWTETECCPGQHRWLLAIPSRERLLKVLSYLLDENEFLSAYGIRSLSKHHGPNPYTFEAGGQSFRVAYAPGESDTAMFGGNSNWRGPVWFPVNYLLIEALERYHHYYGNNLTVECPTGSGNRLTLQAVARELSGRLTALFRKQPDAGRPCLGGRDAICRDASGEALLLFHEYFHAENGCGLGAEHQTGWTALATRLLEKTASSNPAG